MMRLRRWRGKQGELARWPLDPVATADTSQQPLGLLRGWEQLGGRVYTHCGRRCRSPSLLRPLRHHTTALGLTAAIVCLLVPGGCRATHSRVLPADDAVMSTASYTNIKQCSEMGIDNEHDARWLHLWLDSRRLWLLRELDNIKGASPNTVRAGARTKLCSSDVHTQPSMRKGCATLRGAVNAWLLDRPC